MPSERDRSHTPGVGVVSGEIDEDTVRRSPLGRAVRETQQTVRGAADRVEDLRRELGGRIDQLVDKVDRVEVTGARMEGKLDILCDELSVARRASSAIHVSAVTAQIEVEKTGEIAKVEEAAAGLKFKRARDLKIIAIVGSVATALATLTTLLAGRC